MVMEEGIHIKKNYKNHKKTENDSANAVTKEVHDTLVFVVHGLVDE